MKRVLSLLVLVLMLTSLLGSCGAQKVFEAKELQITLTDEFSESLRSSFTAAFESYDVAVLITREERKMIEEAADSTQVSLEDYGAMVLENSDLDCEMTIEDGLYTFSYNNTVEDKIYSYFATVHQSEDAYWLVQFVVPTAKYKSEKKNILKYAKSIRFDESYTEETTSE